jgi:Ca2+/Na+ antiporter
VSGSAVVGQNAHRANDFGTAVGKSSRAHTDLWILKAHISLQITLDSTGITYSAISLIATLGIFYLLLSINRFKLDKKFGVSCVMFYAIFLVFTLLLELDMPFPINFPATVAINGLI